MPVRTYDLEMDPTDLAWLRRNPGSLRCFAAELRTDSGRWTGWIGARGRYSRYFRKPSYDLWFSREQPFEGWLGVHLTAGYRDPSLLRTRLSMEVFDSLGVPVPSSSHVWVNLNGEPLGVYTAIEPFDGGWMARRGKHPGAVYYAVGTKGNFGLIDPDTGRPKRQLGAGYEKAFPADDQIDDLQDLIYQITLPEPAEFEAEIDSVIDVEMALRWLIGVEMLSHTDGLVQNFALFREQGGRWQISPWDLDGTWGRIPNGDLVSADYMPVGTGEDNYLMARLLRSNRWRSRYLALWEELLDRQLAPERLIARMADMFAEISPYALKDEQKRLSNQTFRREPQRMMAFIRQRDSFVREALLLGPPRRQIGARS